MSVERKMRRLKAKAERKNFKHYHDEVGNKIVPLRPEAQGLVAEQLAAFKAKFGREPGPSDPVFFDPDCDVPTAMNEKKLGAIMVEAMKQANIPARFIYAYEKTGLILTEATYHDVLPEDRAAWDQAMAEFDALN